VLLPFTPDAGTLKIKLTQPVEDDKLLRIWFEYEGNIGYPMEVNRITPVGWNWVSMLLGSRIILS